MSDDNPESIELRTLWIGIDELDVTLANQFATQVDHNGEIFLTIGQISPPLLIGTPEQQRDQARNLGYVPIRPLGRYTMTRQQLDELRTLLDAAAANHDHITGRNG
jgi:hypothetical protein